MDYISTPQLVLAFVGIFAIAWVFSIFGRGGGEFRLPLLISIVALPFTELKIISVFLILVQGIVMMLVYSGKHKLTDWPLAVLLAGIVGVASFLGGFFSLLVPPVYLKGLFAAMLLISALKMALGKGTQGQRGRVGVWHRKMPGPEGEECDVNLAYLVIPVLLVGFISGMLGISGCGLIIPLCVILGGVPLRIAIGTNTLLLITSTASSFVGHVIKARFYWELALILAVAAAVGAYLGSRQHTKISEKNINRGFILILVVAAVWMLTKMFD
jgi:uncharacterized membrane protein YfcA